MQQLHVKNIFCNTQSIFFLFACFLDTSYNLVFILLCERRRGDKNKETQLARGEGGGNDCSREMNILDFALTREQKRNIFHLYPATNINKQLHTIRASCNITVHSHRLCFLKPLLAVVLIFRG